MFLTLVVPLFLFRFCLPLAVVPVDDEVGTTAGSKSCGGSSGCRSRVAGSGVEDAVSRGHSLPCNFSLPFSKCCIVFICEPLELLAIVDDCDKAFRW